MSDGLEAPVVDTPAPDVAPAADPSPAPAGPPPSRIDVIRNAVAAQKEKAAPRAEIDKPAAAAPAGDRPRAPDGKFVAAAPIAATDRPAPDRKAAPAAPAVAVVAPVADAPAPAADAFRAPPGFSPQSKVFLDSAPDYLKADIAKRESEVNKGFEKLARYKGVDKFIEMAERGGTTLDMALEQYTGIENLLRRDVFAGVEQVLRNVGVNPVSFAQAYLARSQGRQPAPGETPNPARQPAIDPKEIARQVREQVQADFENQRLAESVNRFAADPKNRFFDNVKPRMQQLLTGGAAQTIEEAYDMACRLDPTIAPLLNQPAPVDPNAVKAAAAASAARAAAKAVTGAPAPGMAPGTKAQNPNASRRDIIVAAVAAQKARA